MSFYTFLTSSVSMVFNIYGDVVRNAYIFLVEALISDLLDSLSDLLDDSTFESSIFLSLIKYLFLLMTDSMNILL